MALVRAGLVPALVEGQVSTADQSPLFRITWLHKCAAVSTKARKGHVEKSRNTVLSTRFLHSAPEPYGDGAGWRNDRQGRDTAGHPTSRAVPMRDRAPSVVPSHLSRRSA